ncbi:MAG: hypothetical protein ACK6EB_46310, partial [Planctomyces sp.]
YTQITSAITDVAPNIEDYDDEIIGWRVAAIEDASDPSGIRSARREYRIHDDRLTNNIAIAHSSVPLWYGSPEEEIGTDPDGQRATAPRGYLAESFDITDKSLQATRPRVHVGQRRFPRLFDDVENYTYT